MQFGKFHSRQKSEFVAHRYYWEKVNKHQEMLHVEIPTLYRDVFDS